MSFPLFMPQRQFLCCSESNCAVYNVLILSVDIYAFCHIRIDTPRSLEKVEATFYLNISLFLGK